MKEALLYGSRDLRLVESPNPKAGPEDVIVAVRACGVCPTDVRKYILVDKSHQMTALPMNLGHEWAGDVVEVGSAVRRNVHVGMRVIGVGYGGYAEFIRAGNEVIDPTVNVRIVDTLFPIPEGVSYEWATITEPLACAMHAVRDQARVGAGDTVVVMGAGQMGLLKLIVANLMGARVVVSDPIQERLAWARKFGAALTVDPRQGTLVDEVKQLTGGKGADSVIVSPGIPEMVGQAVELVRMLGRVVLFGGFPKGTKVSIDPNVIHYGEVILTGCEWVGAVPSENDMELHAKALQLIARGQVPVKDLITHQFALADVEKAFEIVEKKQGLKAVVHVP